MYMQISFVVGSTLDSVEITLGEKDSPIISCALDKMSVELIRQFFEDHKAIGGSGAAVIEDKKPRIQIFGAKENEDKEMFLSAIEEGLEHYDPEMCEEGVNGTYFLLDKDGNKLAVFKPEDEEGKSENNPKYENNEEDVDLSKGLLEGEGVRREVAAYMLDHGHFSGVPRTSLARFEGFRGDKAVVGSLQEFIPNVGASWDMGPNVFPVHQVHKIGILDLRIMNVDRHGGNILVNRNGDGTFSLTPIDHGFSLTDSLDKAEFDWVSWPQAKKPFDSDSLAYIRSLDIEQDAKILEGLGIRKECIRTMKITTTLLKRGAANGLTLFEIGSMVTRMIYGEASELEILFAHTLNDLSMNEDDLLYGENEQHFLENLYRLMDVAIESKLQF